MQEGFTLIGWREWLALPELGIWRVCAKIDTGARSSSLHVDRLETFFQDNNEWVRFSINPGRRSKCAVLECQAPILDRRMVRDSGGQSTERIFIRTRLVMGQSDRVIEINLTNRRNMLFPLLLGRTALDGYFRVDPARSFVLGQ